MVAMVQTPACYGIHFCVLVLYALQTGSIVESRRVPLRRQTAKTAKLSAPNCKCQTPPPPPLRLTVLAASSVANKCWQLHY